MMNKSDYLRNAILNRILRGVPFPDPLNWFVALFNVTPTSAGGGTEVTGGGYVRLPIAFSLPVLGETSNSAPLNYPTPTTDWDYIPGVAIFDAVTAGNMLYFGELGTPRTVYAGDDIFFPASYFAISEK